MMKKLCEIIGWLLMVAGIIAGIWVALGIFFTGGLLQMAAGFCAFIVEDIIIGICKVLFFWIPGIIVMLVSMLIGGILLEWSL